MSASVQSLPTPRTMYRALSRRDAAYEGVFFTGVKTTGIFCRPTCKAKRPRAENVEFFPTVTEALHGGYRPCRLCRPMDGTKPVPPLVERLRRAAEAAPDLDAWIEAKLRAGERLMGFGHRVYSGNDPRAEAMRESLQRMGQLATRLDFATRLEAAVAAAIERVKPGRTLPPNVEIVATLLLDAVGFPREGFTPVFAACRVAGWLAHAMEQQKTGRMIRPTSAYVGPPVG